MNADGIIKSSDDAVPVEGFPKRRANTAALALGVNWKDLSFMVSFVPTTPAVHQFSPTSEFSNILYGDWRTAGLKDNPNADGLLPRWRPQAENIGDYYLCRRLLSAA